MKVLVTRPLEDGEETARQLALRGHQALLAPLLTTRFLDGPEVSLKMCRRSWRPAPMACAPWRAAARAAMCALFAVGPQTAAEAQSLGFQSVKSADGDARALAGAARDWARPGKGALLHVAGEGNDGKLAAAPDKGALLHVAGEGNDGKLVQMLAGFSVRQEILYAVTAVEKMPEAAATGAAPGPAGCGAVLLAAQRRGLPRLCAIKENLPVEQRHRRLHQPGRRRRPGAAGFPAASIAAQPNQASLLQAA